MSNNPVKYVDPTGMFESEIDKAVNNNLGEDYIEGDNDCDQWLQDVLEESGYAITKESWWDYAHMADVPMHREDMKDILKDKPGVGTNIGLAERHAILLHLNEDGSVEVAHTSSTNRSEKSERYEFESMEAFKRWSSNETYEYYTIPNTSSPSDEGASSSASNTESANISPSAGQKEKHWQGK